VKVTGKVGASGAIELRNGVSIGDKIESKCHPRIWCEASMSQDRENRT
jgi:hypothetical protein